MSDPFTNGIATASQFRQAAESSAYGEPERVTLPKCGLPVILRRPRLIAFSLCGFQTLPDGERPKMPEHHPDEAVVEFAGEFGEEERRQRIQNAQAWAKLLKAVFVKPGLSLDPTSDEIHPDWIPEEDQVFLLGWAKGVVGSDGSGLDHFRQLLGLSPAPRVNGENVQYEAERISGTAN